MTATVSSAWSSVAPALADHLWQSSFFAAAAGLLTLTLRKNHARARYWLWLAASVKFLVPFSWLISLGSRMSWIHAAPAVASADSYLAVEQISQPFTQRGMNAIPTQTISASLSHWLPGVLAIIWLAGFIAVLLTWLARWRQVSGQIRTAVPLHEGREVEALQRVQYTSGIRKQIRMLLSKTMLEPGIFGMLSPVLVWPKGISERLENAHLEAILAHELWHVRRRDNLAAAMHMMIEAIFWFHPLVWWLGARMVDERERACDEEVLELGSERQIYAESILKVCEFCVGSPLACVAGVTGADLKKRMVHIMSEHVVRKLDFSKKLLLTTVAAAAIAAPIVFGLMHVTPIQARAASDDVTASASAYGSVSIKPSAVPSEDNGRAMKHAVRMMHTPEGFTAAGVTLRTIIEEAYGVQANQIKGGPDWLDSARYDIDAKVGKSGENTGFRQPNRAGTVIIADDQRASDNRHMLQTLLADRASLVLHRESMNLPSYALTVGDSGSKLRPTEGSGSTVDAHGGAVKTRDEEMEMKLGAEGREKKDLGAIMKDRRVIMKMDEGHELSISAQGLSAEDLCQQLSRLLGAPVTNQTALKGRYDFNLQWPRGAGESPAGEDSASSPSDPSALLTAVQEQLGLKLVPQNVPSQVLVIDRIEKPAEN